MSSMLAERPAVRPAVPLNDADTVPPPPLWFVARRCLPDQDHPPDPPARLKIIIGRCGDMAHGVVLSAILHLILLLGLFLWKAITMPQAAGFVIVSSLVTGDEGALPEVQTIIDAVEPADGGGGEKPLELAAMRAVPLPSGSDEGAFGEGGLARGLGGGGVGFFGTRAIAGSFVFVIDCSGSMQGARFTRAVAELEQAILQLSPRQRFYVIFYNSEAIPLFAPDAADGLLYASQERRVEARRWIHSRSAGGDTQPQEAIRMALGLRPDVVFFLTDGEIPSETERVAQRYNQAGTVIHTTGFTSRNGEQILKAIADESDGTYRYIE